MLKEELIYEIKQRMSAIYIAMDIQFADDLHRIFVETLKHLENK
jgi:ribosomal protein S6